jgi:hypothetical protein
LKQPNRINRHTRLRDRRSNQGAEFYGEVRRDLANTFNSFD